MKISYTLRFFSLVFLLIGLLSCGEKDISLLKPTLEEEPTGPPVDETELDYKVWVNGVEMTVHEARVQDPPFNKEATELDFGGDYAFASFDIDQPVEIKIESGNRNLSHTILRSLDDNNVSELNKSDHTLSFRMDKPMQLIVESDGKKAPLLLFANPIEDFQPDPNDPNVIYFGPGEHHPEDALIWLSGNQTLYVDEGAVVYAGVHIEGNNVTVRGRGIISGNEFVWGEFARHLIQINNSSKVTVKDVILQGGATWSMVTRNSEDILVDNVKIVGGRAQNDDGINPVNSRDVHITNCFIRTDDDCIALKGMDSNGFNVERITVENCILWCDRARIFLLGHESRAAYMRDLTFKNLAIVHFSMTPFLLEPGENMRLENVVFEDIRINGEGQDEFIRLKPEINQYMETQAPGYIYNITFKNMEVTGKGGPYKIQLIGTDEEYSVRNVKIEDLYILGKKVNADYDYFEIGNYVYDFNLLSLPASQQ